MDPQNAEGFAAIPDGADGHDVRLSRRNTDEEPRRVREPRRRSNCAGGKRAPAAEGNDHTLRSS
jgi:hypothetical protein